MALLETLTLVLGIIYGYVSPGRENRGELLRKGLMIGIVLAVISQYWDHLWAVLSWCSAALLYLLK